MLSVRRVLLLPVILLRASLVSAAPTLSFPINSQVPPVARVGQAFSFVFSTSTFTSSAGPSSSPILSYSLIDPPTWLYVDSDSHTLYGTPEDSDIALGTVVGVNVTLVATDATGSTIDDATLVVSRSPGPSVQVPISEQIKDFGHYSEPSSLLYYPAASFRFTFAPDTFADPDAASLNYYTVMADNSPLPAWISFDPGDLAFAGTTPPFSSLVEPPQNFAMKLVASDVTGFSAADVEFSIVVGSHALTTDQVDITLNATAGEELRYDGLAGTVQLDGRPADTSNVNVTAKNLPSWLSLDPASWTISGTPTDKAEATNFTVVVADMYEDKLNITFDVRVTSNDSLFQGAFPSFVARAGEHMSFDLGSYLVNPAGVGASADIQPATSWISWDATFLTLSGDVPSSATGSIIDVTFTVESKGSTKLKRATSQSQKLTIQVESVLESTSSSATTTSNPTSSRTAAATSTSSPPSPNGNTGAHPWTIVAIVISTVAGLALIIWLCFCCRRRKNKRHSQSSLDESTRMRSGPPSNTLIHTPGHAIGSPDPQGTVSPKEKEKIKALKASKLRTELTPPPPRPARSPEEGGEHAYFDDADTPGHDGPSATTTPGSGLRLGWFSSLRSFRVVNMRRVRPRASSVFFSDYGSSHHDLDLDFGFQSSPLPPVLNLPHHHSRSDVSFEDDVQRNLPPVSRSGRRVSKVGNNSNNTNQNKHAPLLPTPGASSIRLVEKDPFTDTPPRLRANEGIISPIAECDRGSDPFNSHPVSPLDSNGPHSAPLHHQHGHGIALTTPPSTSTNGGGGNGPSSLLASSSLLPTSVQPPRRATTMPISTSPTRRERRQGPARGALRSQRSNASSNASSTDTMRARARHKLAAKAKGALFVALQSPKRRTLAALGRPNSGGGGGGGGGSVFSLRPRKKRSNQRGMLESVDCDSTSVLNGRSESRNGGGGGGGIAGFLSPKMWPQHANGKATTTTTTNNQPADDASPTPRTGTDPFAAYGQSETPQKRRKNGPNGGGARVSSRGSLRAMGFPPPPPRCSLPPIRRRPVPARTSAGSASISASASGSHTISSASSEPRSSVLSGHTALGGRGPSLSSPPPAAAIMPAMMPSPLRTPSRAAAAAAPYHGGAASAPPAAPAGLGIINNATTSATNLYEDVANSSPYDRISKDTREDAGNRETSWATSASCGGTIIDRERERRGSLAVSYRPRGSGSVVGGGWASAPATVSRAGAGAAARRFGTHEEVDEGSVDLLSGGDAGMGVGAARAGGEEEEDRYSSGRSSSHSGNSSSGGVGGGRAFV